MRKTITTTTITSLGFNPNSTKYIKKKMQWQIMKEEELK